MLAIYWWSTEGCHDSAVRRSLLATGMEPGIMWLNAQCITVVRLARVACEAAACAPHAPRTLRPSRFAGLCAMWQNRAAGLETERRGDLQRHLSIRAHGCRRTHILVHCALRALHRHRQGGQQYRGSSLRKALCARWSPGRALLREGEGWRDAPSGPGGEGGAPEMRERLWR